MQNPSQARLKEIVEYDAETGIFTWLGHAKKAPKGKRAGSVGKEGYRFIRVDKVLCQEHRLAWLYVTGEWPEAEIDHIDRDKANNALGNLRLATRREQEMNKGIQRNNKSGVRGVSWNKAAKKWAAQISVNGKQKHLGLYADLEAASEAYRQAVKVL